MLGITESSGGAVELNTGGVHLITQKFPPSTHLTNLQNLCRSMGTFPPDLYPGTWCFSLRSGLVDFTLRFSNAFTPNPALNSNGLCLGSDFLCLCSNRVIALRYFVVWRDFQRSSCSSSIWKTTALRKTAHSVCYRKLHMAPLKWKAGQYW